MIRSQLPPRRRRTRLAAAATAAVLLTACGSAPGADPAGGGVNDRWKPVEAEAGTDIPEVDVKFGMRPYADNTFWVIAMEKGWFKDVGINITPEPTGLTTAESQWTNLLLNGEVDVNSSTSGMLPPTYEASTELKQLAHAVTFFGQVMFAKADLGLKTVQQYIDEGQDFETALKSALEPLSGAKVYVPPGATEKVFLEKPFEMAGLELPDFQPTEDSDMFLLAQAGKIDFLHPGGAPIAYELLDLGWTPVYDTRQLVENGPSGVDSPLAALIHNQGFAAKGSWVSENQETVLRILSVMYRIAAETAADPSLFDLQAPYLNSVAGTDQVGADVAATFTNMHPLRTFEEAGEAYYLDESSSQYYKTTGNSQIKALVEAGLLTKEMEADDFIWGAGVYMDLLSYQEKADELFTEAESASLDAEGMDLIAQAKEFYEWYDFLDAYRFAAAALDES
jgi:ABC-type nitrate/sulfonate/bicarbonate transport system substrate-binding protein